MYENMVGVVGFAMHEDRLAQASKNMRRAEAEQGRQARADAAHRGYRAAMGRIVLTLAVRIAPAVALPKGHTLATGR